MRELIEEYEIRMDEYATNDEENESRVNAVLPMKEGNGMTVCEVYSRAFYKWARQ